MSILRIERLVAHDGTIIEERNYDGFGKLVSKRKNIPPQTNTSQELKTMTRQTVVKPMASAPELKFHSSGIGYLTLSQLVQQQLDRLDGDDYYSLRELYEDHIIYSASTAGKLYKRSFSVSNDQVELMDDITEVVEKTEYTDIKHSKAGTVPPLHALGFNHVAGTSRVQIGQPLTLQQQKQKYVPKVRAMCALGVDYSNCITK